MLVAKKNACEENRIMRKMSESFSFYSFEENMGKIWSELLIYLMECHISTQQ